MSKNLMDKFIDQQPSVVEKIISDELTIEDKLLEDIEEIIFVGSGSSLYAAKMGNHYFETYTNLKTFYLSPIEYLNKSSGFDTKHLLISISQSGSSKTTLEALKRAKDDGNPTIFISATTDENKKRFPDKFIDIFCPTETIGPKTVGVLATLVRLIQLAMAIASSNNLITRSESEEKITEILMQTEKIPSIKNNIQKWAKEHKWWSNLSYVTVTSDESMYPVIEEGSLKLLETLRKPVLPYKIEEFTHGPHRLIANDSFHIIVANDKSTDMSYRVKKYAKKFTKNILYLSDKNSDIFLNIENNQLGSEIIYLLVFQVLANELALLSGFNPDEKIHSEFFEFVGTKE